MISRFAEIIRSINNKEELIFNARHDYRDKLIEKEVIL